MIFFHEKFTNHYHGYSAVFTEIRSWCLETRKGIKFSLPLLLPLKFENETWFDKILSRLFGWVSSDSTL